MRTYDEIADHIKQQWLHDAVLRNLYQLDPDTGFDEQLSSASLEAAIIHVFAASVHLMEQVWDDFEARVSEVAASAPVLNARWYHDRALEYQHGDTLRYLPGQYRYGYETADDTKRCIRYAAVRDGINDSDGVPILRICYSDKDRKAVSTEQSQAFQAYIRQIGAAGTHYQFVNGEPKELRIRLDLYRDPLLLDAEGNRLDGQGGKPVDQAVEAYLDSVDYGGTVHVSRLTQAILGAYGVADAQITGLSTDGGGTYSLPATAESSTGSFTPVLETTYKI